MSLGIEEPKVAPAPAARPRKEIPPGRLLKMKIAAVLLGLVPALAFFVVLGWTMRDQPSEDALIYAKLHEKLRLHAEVTVPWPEHPSGELRMNEYCPTYRRPWDVTEDKPSTVPERLLFLGDSHTEGYCRRNESFTSILDEILSPTQVVNCGISGWSPVDAFRYYRDHLKNHDFDHVVYVFYAGNDFAEMFRPGSWQLIKREGGKYRDHYSEALPPLPEWKASLFSAHLLPDLFLTSSEGRILRSQRMWFHNPGSIDQQYLQQMFFRDHPEKVEEGRELLRWIFAEMKRLAAERNSSFRVAVLPTRHMIEPEKMDSLAVQARRTLKLTEASDGTDLLAYGAALKAARESGVEVVDLVPPLQKEHAENPDDPLYWRIDFHLSTYGHPAVAVALLNAIFPTGDASSAQ